MRLPADIFDKRQEGACALVPHPNLLPCFALSGTTQDGEGLPSVCSLCSLWRDPPSSLQVSEQTPQQATGFPPCRLESHWPLCPSLLLMTVWQRL